MNKKEYPENEKPARLGWTLAALSIAGLVGSALLLSGCGDATAGPNGGDVVTLDEGSTKAELLANEDTGEVMIHTWDETLETAKPIAAKPLSIEADGKSIELAPHPTASDPAGTCSRFYGQADWVRGGAIRHGSIHVPGMGPGRRDFDWKHSWNGGRSHGPMWSEMPGHGRHGGGGMGGHN